MKEIILGIAISIQTLRGCIAQEIKLPQYDTQFALQFSTDRIKACVIDPKKYTKATDHLKLSEDIKDNLHIHLFHELCY